VSAGAAGPAAGPAPGGGAVVYVDGAFVARADARLSPDDRGFLFGDGVYEVARAVDGRFFALDAHLARLARGAAALALPLPPGGVDRVAAVWEALLDRNGLRAGEAVAYCQVTRGAAPRAHAFPPAGTPATVYAYAQRLEPPDALRAAGAACVTYPDLRWGRCDLKTVNLLPNVLARQAAAAAGAFEAVLVRPAGGDAGDADAPLVGGGAPRPADDGVVTEGSLSTVFAVLGGELRTHPLGPRVLPGVTRAAVLALAAELGVPAREAPYTLGELRAADELFVANTTADVMPVVALDGRAVGGGRPGPVSRALAAALAARVGRADPAAAAARPAA
jgi:D-alanine transaminase